MVRSQIDVRIHKLLGHENVRVVLSALFVGDAELLAKYGARVELSRASVLRDAPLRRELRGQFSELFALLCETLGVLLDDLLVGLAASGQSHHRRADANEPRRPHPSTHETAPCHPMR